MVRVHWAAIWHDQMDFGFQWLTEMIDAASVSSGAARVIVPSTKEYHRRDSMYQLSKNVMYKVLGVNLTLVAGQWGLVPNWPTHFPHLWKSPVSSPASIARGANAHVRPNAALLPLAVKQNARAD